MSHTGSEHGAMSCRDARNLMHSRLDGDRIGDAMERAYGEHLAGCSDCRAVHEELDRIQFALRSLPVPPLPDTALERVWRETSRSSGTRPRRTLFQAGGHDWRPVAAAAALGAVLVGVWAVRAPGGPSQSELERAAAEARMVLAVTGRTLSQTEEVAIRKVLVDEVSPALERVLPGPRGKR